MNLCAWSIPWGRKRYAASQKTMLPLPNSLLKNQRHKRFSQPTICREGGPIDAGATQPTGAAALVIATRTPPLPSIANKSKSKEKMAIFKTIWETSEQHVCQPEVGRT